MTLPEILTSAERAPSYIGSINARLNLPSGPADSETARCALKKSSYSFETNPLALVKAVQPFTKEIFSVNITMASLTVMISIYMN